MALVGSWIRKEGCSMTWMWFYSYCIIIIDYCGGICMVRFVVVVVVVGGHFEVERMGREGDLFVLQIQIQIQI